MQGLHSELARWIIEDGYRKVLARPGPHCLNANSLLSGFLQPVLAETIRVSSEECCYRGRESPNTIENIGDYPPVCETR